MMTPSELREYEFKGAGRNAYKADDVDAFFGGVAVAYEKMYRENAELVKRVSMLADRLEQYKNDENEIKQAVLSAQKAADIIVKQAELSVEDTKAEAEAILAAAKGEADIIKSDAEKQAVADSDLLLSIARDKAEEIINKAKEEAHGILIAANDSASDTVGAATRTITSESIHYEMLKKEVSDFRASILAQYKAHIEMISKLPELAAEEAEKAVPEADDTQGQTPAEADEIINEDTKAEEVVTYAPIDDSEAIVDFAADAEDEDAGEDVVKTTLPYDFFDDTATVEFIEEEEEQVEELTAEAEASEYAVEEDDTIDSDDISVDFYGAATEPTEEAPEQSDDEKPADIPISRGFSLDTANVDDEDMANLYSDSSELSSSLFDSIEKIDSEDDENSEEAYDDEEEDSSKGGFFSFFRHKK